MRPSFPPVWTAEQLCWAEELMARTPGTHRSRWSQCPSLPARCPGHTAARTAACEPLQSQSDNKGKALGRHASGEVGRTLSFRSCLSSREQCPPPCPP